MYMYSKCVWDGGGWTDPQWRCQRAESVCLGRHNVAVSLRDITHINSLTHTRTHLQSSGRPTGEERERCECCPRLTQTIHHTDTVWEQCRPGNATGQQAATHTHARPEKSMPAAHVHTGLCHTHTLKCVHLCVLLARASRLPSETRMWRTDELFAQILKHTDPNKLFQGVSAHFKMLEFNTHLFT